jgi:hypothetical protein
MSYEQFILAHKTVPLGYLISTRKALGLLLVHKTPDARFQFLLVSWTAAFFAILGAALCGFKLMPMFLAASVFALGVCLFALLVCLGTGDIVLKFAFEDQRFFELATRCRALSIFEDTELSLPQPESFSQRQSEEKSKLHTDIVALEDYRASLVLCQEQAPALLVSNGH